MPDKPPKRRRRATQAKTKDAVAPDPKELGLEEAAQAAAEAEPLAGEPSPEPPSGGTDTPPGRAAGEAPRRRRPRVSKQQTKAIEDALRELLQMPAVPAALLGDAWMADHFTSQGDALAAKIAAVSERNPVLRRWCERLMEGEGMAVLLMASIMYAGPPLLHLGVVPGGELIGIPVLARRAPMPSQQAPSESPTFGRSEPEPMAHGNMPPTQPPPVDGEHVAPDAHFVFEGGENGDGPPVWHQQMMQ